MENDLKNHIADIHGPSTSKAVHEEKEPFSCNICSKNFKAENDLNIHIANTHAPSTSSSNLKPVCKSIWQNETCKTLDCPKAHPPRCENPDCLIIDQGLLCRKTLQCRKWHGLPKEKKNNRHFSKPQTRRNRTFSRFSSHVKSFNADIPVWQELNPSSQNCWFKSQNEVPTGSLLGNGLAIWSTPPHTGGSPIWGNQQFVQTVRQAMGIIHMMPFM